MVKLKTKNIGKILNHYNHSEGKGVLLENKKEGENINVPRH